MYQRNIFPDGVIFIDNKNDMSDDCLESFICNNLEIEKNNKDFFSLVGNLRILFIFRFVRRKEDSEFNMFVENLQRKTISKIIIVAEEKLGIEEEYVEELGPLSDIDSALLLKAKAGQNVFVGINQDIDNLKDHKIISLSKGIPAEIINIAHWSKIYKMSQIEENYEKSKKQSYSETFIKQKLRECADITKEVFYLIYILPKGIFETDLLEIYGGEDYRSIDINLNDISNTGYLIISETNKETGLKQFVLNSDSICPQSCLEISGEIKLKSFEKLMSYYTDFLRMIIFNYFSENPTEFSAAQNYGIWKTFNTNLYPKDFAHGKYCSFWFSKGAPKNIVRLNKANRSSNISRYNYYEENIMKILEEVRKENLLSEELKESIAQCSICIPTILIYLKRRTDCFTQGSHFIDLLKQLNLPLEYLRLKLFFNSLHKKEEKNTFEKEFEYLQNEFKKLDSIPGVAENLFCKLSFNIREFNKYEKSKFSEILQDYNSLSELYAVLNDTLGSARLNLAFASFRLENELFDKDSIEELIRMFSEAEKAFKDLGKPLNQFRSLLGKGKSHLHSNNFNAVKGVLKEVESSLQEMRKRRVRTALLDDMYDIVNRSYLELDSSMKDKIQNQSKNLFTFMKAHQLIRIIQNDMVFGRSNSDLVVDLPRNSDVKVLSPILSVPLNFKKKVKNILQNAKQKIDFCFENLEINNFKKSIMIGGKFLHLTSEDFSKSCSLFLENKLGESYEIGEEELKGFLNNAKFAYEIVVLSIYQSESLAKLFHNKVNNVIYFKFKDEFLKFALDLPCHSLLKIMNDFTVSFLEELVRDCNVRNSFEEAKKKFQSEINTLTKAIKRIFNQIFDLEDCVFLLSKKEEFFFNLEISEGSSFEKEPDLSKVRRKPIGLKKRNYPFVGRKLLIHDILDRLLYPAKVLNLFGDPGIGKTEIVKELGYYTYQRNYYSAIFYFCLNNIQSVDALKAMFNENDLTNVIQSTNKNSSILVILDDCDNLIKLNNNQFYLLINSIQTPQTYFILTSVREISSPNLPCEKILITPLETDDEDIYMFLNCCKRSIEKREIDFEEMTTSQLEEKTLIELLKKSVRIRKCAGYPKYIKMLADRCSTISLKYIKTDFLLERLNDLPLLDCIKQTGHTFTSPNSFNIIARLKQQVDPLRTSLVNTSNINSPNNSFNNPKKSPTFNHVTATQTVFNRGKNNDIYKKLSGIEEKEEESMSRKESKKEENPEEPEGLKQTLRGKPSLTRQKSDSLDVILEETTPVSKKDSRLNLKNSITRESKSTSRQFALECPFTKSPTPTTMAENNVTPINETKPEVKDEMCIEPTSNNLLSNTKRTTTARSKAKNPINKEEKKDDSKTNPPIHGLFNKFTSVKVKIHNSTFKRLPKNSQSEKIVNDKAEPEIERPFNSAFNLLKLENENKKKTDL